MSALVLAPSRRIRTRPVLLLKVKKTKKKKRNGTEIVICFGFLLVHSYVKLVFQYCHVYSPCKIVFWLSIGLYRLAIDVLYEVHALFYVRELGMTGACFLLLPSCQPAREYAVCNVIDLSLFSLLFDVFASTLWWLCVTFGVKKPHEQKEDTRIFVPQGIVYRLNVSAMTMTINESVCYQSRSV